MQTQDFLKLPVSNLPHKYHSDIRLVPFAHFMLIQLYAWSKHMRSTENVLPIWQDLFPSSSSLTNLTPNQTIAAIALALVLPFSGHLNHFTKILYVVYLHNHPLSGPLYKKLKIKRTIPRGLFSYDVTYDNKALSGAILCTLYTTISNEENRHLLAN